MASGHAYRVNRPNTWLLRPMLQSEVSSCQPGAVHTWPKADMHPCRLLCRLFEVERTLHYDYTPFCNGPDDVKPPE
jgi:hypothetical protein